MRWVGLTGGIATGKSTFARALTALGAPVVDADALARTAVAPGSRGLAAAAALFGPGVIGADGALDRKAVAARVFADPAARAALERIIHPEVRALAAAARGELAAAGHDVGFYDVPLLFETGLDREVDLVAVVWAPRDVQLARLMARDGLDRAAAEARLAAQLPVDEKAARADAILVNDGSVAALAALAAPFLADVRGGLARRLPTAPPARYAAPG